MNGSLKSTGQKSDDLAQNPWNNRAAVDSEARAPNLPQAGPNLGAVDEAGGMVVKTTRNGWVFDPEK